MPTHRTKRRTRPAVERFWPKVSKGNGCWVWIGAIGGSFGYGHFYDGSRVVQAHRFSWELHYGPIPDGLWALHHCDNPPCVRPDHLFLGDALDNVRNMIAKGRQVIPNPTRRHDPIPADRVQRGEAASQSKLTDGLVRYIRDEASRGYSQREIAKRLHVSPMAISRVVRRESWSHID